MVSSCGKKRGLWLNEFGNVGVKGKSFFKIVKFCLCLFYFIFIGFFSFGIINIYC